MNKKHNPQNTETERYAKLKGQMITKKFLLRFIVVMFKREQKVCKYGETCNFES
jgi:hypothetical protein